MPGFGWKTCLAALAVWLLPGCATAPPPTQRNLSEVIGLEHGTISKIGVLQPDITLRELAAGGSAQERADWSALARATARDTLETLRSEKFIYFRDETIPDELQAEIIDLQALFRTAVLNDFASYAIGPPPTAGQPRFGSVDTIMDHVGADALLLVYGVDDIFTADRQVLTALGVIAAGLTGVAVIPSGGVAHLNAVLLARDGRVLWYNRLYQDQISDLRELEGVRKTLKSLLRTLPPSAVSD